MSRIDCERFSTLLAELLAEAPSGPSDPRAEAIREHARACPACAESADLVALAVTPAGRRDPIDDPGPAYWDDFGRRLHGRLGARFRIGRVAVLAAAAAAVAGAIVWVGMARHDQAPVAAAGGYPSATSAPAVALDDAAAPDEDASVDFGAPEPLDAYADDDAGGLFPAVDQLSKAEQERLVRRLKEEEARVKRSAT
ncbi:MAG TPA: hypothetical protein VFV19_19295 [Candidatus Polarisedimenticolaceae bacterium]|nr:hypothetical protein [Candidatus Polarisedimenticolaceae bacterium]